MALEKIQKHFTRRIPALRDLSYGERLAVLGLETLELRRLKCDLILYYKILNGLSSLATDTYFQFVDHLRFTRSLDKLQLSKPLSKSKCMDNDFFVRKIDAWNCLPIEVKRLNSIAAFKRALSSLDFTSWLVVKL